MNEHSSPELSRAVHYERNAAVTAHMLRKQAALAATRTTLDASASQPRRFGWLPVRIDIRITR